MNWGWKSSEMWVYGMVFSAVEKLKPTDLCSLFNHPLMSTVSKNIAFTRLDRVACNSSVDTAGELLSVFCTGTPVTTCMPAAHHPSPQLCAVST